MSVDFFLGIWQGGKCQRLKVENIDFNSKVGILKKCLSHTLGQKDVDLYEFTYCGLQLDQNKPLSTYEISRNGTVYVHSKRNRKPVEATIEDEPKQKVSEEIIQNFLSTFRKFKATPNHSETLERLENVNDLETILAAVPGLQDDPIAFAFISKADLYLQLENPKTCWNVFEKNPMILTAALYVMTEFHETTPKSENSSTWVMPEMPPSPYALETFSDEEDDGGVAAAMAAAAALADSHHPTTSSTSATGTREITAAQLAAALAASAPGTSAADSSGSSSGSSHHSSLITSSMIQQGLAPFNDSRAAYRDQLQQMKEMGLNNENHNLRALMAVQGDLQAAVDLVFSGAFDD